MEPLDKSVNPGTKQGAIRHPMLQQPPTELEFKCKRDTQIVELSSDEEPSTNFSDAIATHHKNKKVHLLKEK
jgi:hypothetical protein